MLRGETGRKKRNRRNRREGWTDRQTDTGTERRKSGLVSDHITLKESKVRMCHPHTNTKRR